MATGVSLAVVEEIEAFETCIGRDCARAAVPSARRQALKATASEMEVRGRNRFSSEVLHAKHVCRAAPVTTGQHQQIRDVGRLDAPGKFLDAAQTFSLYTISLGLVPDSLFESRASKASKE